MARHELTPLDDNWYTAGETIAFSNGKGSDKDLRVSVRFDGNGNSVVRFVVTDHGKEVTYEKFDAAAEAYNRLR